METGNPNTPSRAAMEAAQRLHDSMADEIEKMKTEQPHMSFFNAEQQKRLDDRWLVVVAQALDAHAESVRKATIEALEKCPDCAICPEHYRSLSNPQKTGGGE